MINNFIKPIIIYNPFAGHGRAKKTIQKYKKILIDSNLFNNIDTFESSIKAETFSKIKEIHENKTNDLIISCGGDGSLSTICNGLMKIPINDRLPIFPLPMGSGNSVLRDFKIYKIKHSIEHYKKNSPSFFDLIFCEEVNGSYKWYCINIAGMGFISDIAYYSEKYCKIFGAFGYIIGMFLALGRFRPYKTTIFYDNNKKFQSDKVYFLSFSNTKYTGGSIRIAPNAKHDDGLMDVMALYEINRLKFLYGFIKTFSGDHIKIKGCAYFNAASAVVESNPDFILMPDGELEGKSPFKFTIIPKQIKMIV